MHEEAKNRLSRQLNLGRDNGMRLKLSWQSGFTVTVNSWEAASAIIGRVSTSTLRQYWYKELLFKENLADGFECKNPDTQKAELVFFEMEQPARRGARVDPEVQARKVEELKAKAAKQAAKLRETEAELERLCPK